MSPSLNTTPAPSAGSFGPATNFTVGTFPTSVAIGDLNLDGKPDLAVANSGIDNVSILLGDGTGSFGLATNFAVGTFPTSVSIGDLNGDGKPDLAVANYNSNNVSILLGTGTGSFGLATNFAVGSGSFSVAIDDLNLDGKPDLAVANSISNNVSILLNQPAGSAKASFPALEDPGASFQEDEKSGIFGCGSIDIHGGDGPGDPGGLASILALLALPFILRLWRAYRKSIGLMDRGVL